MPSPSALITSHSSSNMSVVEVKATLSDPLVLLDMEIECHSPAGFTVECSQSVYSRGCDTSSLKDVCTVVNKLASVKCFQVLIGSSKKTTARLYCTRSVVPRVFACHHRHIMVTCQDKMQTRMIKMSQSLVCVLIAGKSY